MTLDKVCGGDARQRGPVREEARSFTGRSVQSLCLVSRSGENVRPYLTSLASSLILITSIFLGSRAPLFPRAHTAYAVS